MPGFFQLQKHFQRHIFTGGKRIWINFIFLNRFKRQCSQALTQCNSVARPRLMHSSVLFKRSKHPLQSGKGKATERRSWNMNQVVPVSWDLIKKDWYWLHANEEEMCNSLDCFQNYDAYQWQAYFLATKNCFAVLLGQWCMKSALMPGLHLYFPQGELKSASSWCCSKPECLVQTRTLGKTKPREYRSSFLLQTWSGKERQRGRAWVVPWRLKSSRREHRQNGYGALGKEPCSMLQRKAENPQRLRWLHS